MLKDSIVKRAAAFNVTDYTNEELDFYMRHSASVWRKRRGY